MFITVKLLRGYQKPLLYAIPAAWSEIPSIGSIVQVPLRAKHVAAVVTEVMKEKPSIAHFVIKDALHIEKMPQDHHFFTFIQHLAAYYALEPEILMGRLRHCLTQKPGAILQAPARDHAPSPLTLLPEQAISAETIIRDIDTARYAPSILHGVTGSGKTEVYKTAMVHALSMKKSILYLLPEVSLAVAFAHRLRAELSQQTHLYSFHSAVGALEKRALWNELLIGNPVIIIGVHQPVLLPIANLGLIIVDEEHDIGYQEKKHPKINSKDAALLRAQIYNIPIVLGSATPSIPTLYNVQTRGWHYIQLTRRFQGAFPEIEVVLLTDKKQRRNFWISTPLYTAIKDRLSKQEQTILFINRRGYSFFVQCKVCSFVFTCPSCSVSLTLHDHNNLVCHYCSYTQILAAYCPHCKAQEESLLKKGIGTQQVVSVLKKLFPTARIARADLDTTSQKKAWQTILNQMTAGAIDILVGTQTITKGYDFPGVTLVGILWADLNLHFPLFNAAERTLQQLIQVAGRAGRKHQHSKVIVQAMEYHDIFQYLDEQKYSLFFHEAIAQRALLKYPPCIRMAEIEIKHDDEMLLEKESQAMLQTLHQSAQEQGVTIQILGPSKPPVHKIASLSIRKIYLKGPDHRHLVMLFQSLKKQHYSSSFYFTPNPQN